MEGNEDLIPNPPYLFGIVAVLVVGLVGAAVVATLGLAGVIVVVVLGAIASSSSSSFIEHNREDLTPGNCLLTFAPPVRSANGSSSNKKSGGGELRGEVMGLKKVEFCFLE
jgi:hypothetical protein